MKSQSLFKTFCEVIIALMVLQPILVAQTTLVKGKLLDVNGKPSKYALVGTSSYNNGRGQDFVRTDEKGNYSIKLTKSGQNFLVYSIPSHHAVFVPVVNNKDKKINVDVILTPYKFKDNFDEVGVTGSFNNYNYSAPPKMMKQSDGTYTYEVKTDQKEIKYLLTGIEKDNRIINGTESQSFEADSAGDYISVIESEDGKVKIVFDPSLLLKSDKELSVVFRKSKEDEKIYQCFNEYNRLRRDLLDKMREFSEANKNMQDFSFDAGNYFVELLKKIETEKDPFVKDYMKLIYVDFCKYPVKDYSLEKAADFFGSIPPKNLAWDMVPDAFRGYYRLLPNFRLNALMDKFLAESKSNSVKLLILGDKLARAKYLNDEAELKKLHAKIQDEFSDVKEAQNLLKMYPIESKIKVGAEIPDFEVASLDDPNEKISKKSMLGKVYMIDFWATWCGPCVGEMEGIHKAFEKFKDKGFEIVSLSLDQKVEYVTKFRKEKWNMPWKNGFIGDKEGRKIAEEFEVIGIPKPILVGADGKVLATEADMRGSNLEKTLEKYFQ